MSLSSVYGSRATLAALATLLLAGCIGAASPQSRYFIVETAHADAAGADAPLSQTVVVAPVRLPEYLDRPQMIIRRGGGEIQLQEFSRWIEPLDRNLARVIARDLASLLSLDKIPTPDSTRNPDLEISVEVLAFDAYANGDMTLSAQWLITSTRERAVIASGIANLEGFSSPGDYGELAEEMSRMIGVLTAEIANVLRPQA